MMRYVVELTGISAVLVIGFGLICMGWVLRKKKGVAQRNAIALRDNIRQQYHYGQEFR